MCRGLVSHRGLNIDENDGLGVDFETMSFDLRGQSFNQL